MKRILCWLGFHKWWPKEHNRKYFTIWRGEYPLYLTRYCLRCEREEQIKIERPIGEEVEDA